MSPGPSLLPNGAEVVVVERARRSFDCYCWDLEALEKTHFG